MTSKRDKLLEFYGGILTSLDFVVNEDGTIDYMPGDAVGEDGVTPMRVEAHIDGKRWVLPIREILDRSPWDTMVPMHPLSENVNNATTEVINTLQSAMNLRLNGVFGQVFLYLMDFAGSTERQNEAIPARAAKYRQLLPDAKPITVKHATAIADKAEGSLEHRWINLYLRRSAEVDGDKYMRGGIINFPFRDQLDGKEPKAFGVTFSKKDQGTFKALFDYILPDNREDATYSVGSSHPYAPSLDALLRAYHRVATRLNEVIDLHKKLIPGYKTLEFNLDWYPLLAECGSFSDVIPPLPGNIGAVKGAAGEVAPPAVKPNARAAAAQQRFHQPAPAGDTHNPHHTPAEQLPRDSSGPESGSLSQRLAQVRGGQSNSYARASGTGYGPQTMTDAYGQPVRGAYGQPVARDQDIPEWARKGETRMVVAGDTGAPERSEQGQWGSRQGQSMQGVYSGGPSLTERLAAARGNNGSRWP